MIHGVDNITAVVKSIAVIMSTAVSIIFLPIDTILSIAAIAIKRASIVAIVRAVVNRAGECGASDLGALERKIIYLASHSYKHFLIYKLKLNRAVLAQVIRDFYGAPNI